MYRSLKQPVHVTEHSVRQSLILINYSARVCSDCVQICSEQGEKCEFIRVYTPRILRFRLRAVWAGVQTCSRQVFDHFLTQLYM